ncbi:MAG: PSD1 domain-containing protein [Planctomycetaceae bacterium]|nr:PSD1 domain-containing protein [Planctomycetaceae bacterium]
MLRLSSLLILGSVFVQFVLPLEIRGAEGENETKFPAEEIEYFEKKVRPILAERCYECHANSMGKNKGGLILDERDGILKGGDSGPAAVPGNVEESLLIEALAYDPDGLQMPPDGKLPQGEIDILVDWVKRSLPHPAPVEKAEVHRGIDLEAGRKHWAFQPLQEQALPAETAEKGEYKNRIDAFVEAKRREQKLKASPRADGRTLVRRAWFDLLGLPPTPEELDEWVAKLDVSPEGADDAYRLMIEHLLSSPHYGERWGRYWLDVARYADIGEEWREGEGRPWRYRDWVVSAINQDLPYDQFIIRQLAADLLPNAEPAENAALGFLGLSPSYWKELKLDHQVIKQVVAEEWEERLDSLGGAFLGLSIGCARCHDHKFDPITMDDYYALAGVLASIRECDRGLIPTELAEPAIAARGRAKEIEAELKKLRDKKMPTEMDREAIAKFEKELGEVKQTPHFDLALACGVTDSALYVVPDGTSATKLDYRKGEAQDVAVQVRGNPARTGAVVPRRFLSVLSHNPEAKFERGSGRLDLAEAIVGDGGPLAARVMVNRVWKQHFGRGIVETPSNFGLQGAVPSHRELLEDLTARFVANGWSLKWLHLEIMTSETYRQASHRDQDQYALDPENQWLWRFTPRKLDVESWRDAMLAVSQDLDMTLGGEPLDLADPNNHRRTIYGTVKRRELSELLRLYDFPDPVTHSAQRVPTTTPLQQLFVLNGAYFQNRTKSLTAVLLRDVPTEADRVSWLYRRIYQRAASDDERRTGTEYMAILKGNNVPDEEAWREYIHVLLASNEFLFID